VCLAAATPQGQSSKTKLADTWVLLRVLGGAST